MVGVVMLNVITLNVVMLSVVLHLSFAWPCKMTTLSEIKIINDGKPNKQLGFETNYRWLNYITISNNGFGSIDLEFALRV
jgi:hypothetical protein